MRSDLGFACYYCYHRDEIRRSAHRPPTTSRRAVEDDDEEGAPTAQKSGGGGAGSVVRPPPRRVISRLPRTVQERSSMRVVVLKRGAGPAVRTNIIVIITRAPARARARACRPQAREEAGFLVPVLSRPPSLFIIT